MKKRRMHLMGRGLIPMTFLLFLSPGFAWAAEDKLGMDQRLDTLQDRFQKSEDRLNVIISNVENRSGFIDEEEALRRYEDAVFASLMSDWPTAAIEFTILLQTGALKEFGLKSDAEWYLAEAHFGLDNIRYAEDAYLVIMKQGSAHPFFSDSIRRLLEIYGITGENEKFNALYSQYIATNKVEGTELIKYTLAKSFYRQKDWGRAKSMFSDFAPTSAFYGKSRYFVGTILVLQGNLPEAANEFKLATNAGPDEEKRQEVLDLAWLALGRVHYELGNYREATEAYLKVSRESNFFSDQLYELVWTFVKQQEFEEAIRAVDIFLIAFPEHKYTARLRVLRGHLHMKQQRYESALTTYEEVVREYSPVRDLVFGAETSQEQPRVFFERLSKADALQVLNQSGLPPYASEMLREQKEVGRAVRNRRILEEQEKTLKDSNEIVGDIQGTMVAGLSSLGSFRNAKEKVRWLRRDEIDLMGALLTLEEEYVLQVSSETQRQKVDEIRRDRVTVMSNADRSRREGIQQADRTGVMLDQVRAVQAQALFVEQVTRETASLADSLQQGLDIGRYKLPPALDTEVRGKLTAIRTDLNQGLARLQSYQADTFTEAIVGKGFRESESAGSEAEQIFHDHKGVHGRYKALAAESGPSGSASFFSECDSLWERIGKYDQRTFDTMALLDSTEKQEVSGVQQDIAEQATILAELTRELNKTLVKTDDLGAAATRQGFDRLGNFFDNSVMRADMGIVDVYWQRKQQVSDRIDELTREKVKLLKDLDRRFQFINENLEE